MSSRLSATLLMAWVMCAVPLGDNVVRWRVELRWSMMARVARCQWSWVVCADGLGGCVLSLVAEVEDLVVGLLEVLVKCLLNCECWADV